MPEGLEALGVPLVNAVATLVVVTSDVVVLVGAGVVVVVAGALVLVTLDTVVVVRGRCRVFLAARRFSA